MYNISLRYYVNRLAGSGERGCRRSRNVASRKVGVSRNVKLIALTHTALGGQGCDEGGEDGDDDVKDTFPGSFGTFFHDRITFFDLKSNINHTINLLFFTQMSQISQITFTLGKKDDAPAGLEGSAAAHLENELSEWQATESSTAHCLKQ